MTVEEVLIAVDGARLWVGSTGAGPPVMFCSGGPGCCDYLAPVAAMLDRQLRVHRHEPRGCGRSSSDGPYDLETVLTDLDALRVALGHERWLIGGHSAGATVALAYALAYPERTLGVVMMSARGFQNDRSWSEAYHAGEDAGRDQVPEMAYPPNLEVNQVGNAAMHEYIQRPDLWRDIADLDVPVLIVQGADDIRPNWPMAQLAALLPNAEYHELPGAGHVPWFTHADALARLLADFADRASSRASA